MKAVEGGERRLLGLSWKAIIAIRVLIVWNTKCEYHLQHSFYFWAAKYFFQTKVFFLNVNSIIVFKIVFSLSAEMNDCRLLFCPNSVFTETWRPGTSSSLMVGSQRFVILVLPETSGMIRIMWLKETWVPLCVQLIYTEHFGILVSIIVVIQSLPCNAKYFSKICTECWTLLLLAFDNRILSYNCIIRGHVKEREIALIFIIAWE